MTYEEKLGKWVCSAIREGSGETLFLVKTDGKIEDRARLFLNVHGDKRAMNTLEQNEISILGGVRYSTGHSPGQCNLIGPPLSSGLGRDDLQQSLLTGVIL